MSGIATWRPAPFLADYVYDILATDEHFAKRGHIGRVEDFGYAAYPTALNAKTGHWERGGPFDDRVAARLWVERVAGLHSTKPGDERPGFYYDAGGDA